MATKSKKDSLGDRMKTNYENRYKHSLTRRTPVIIRLDGKAFHTFTRGFNRPYDELFHITMNETTKKLCENIQGCKLGYTQSDEISLLLTDFDTLTTDAWFDYELQKMCSIAASMATLYFNQTFAQVVCEYISKQTEITDYVRTIIKAQETGALFDARAFNVPEDEIVNYFIWRQQDATRNAIQMLGQTYFSHNELHKKSTKMIQEMLWQQKGINFNDMPIEFKRGICCIKYQYQLENLDPTSKTSDILITRSGWKIDTEIPIFTKDRSYIETRVVKEY